MSSARFAELRRLFEDCSEMSSDDRVAQLAGIRQSDPALADSLGLMLSALDDGTFELQILRACRSSAKAFLDPVTQPRAIGRYKIERELGRGGAGIVYLGEQGAPKRRVAVKILRSGHPTAQERLRFEREAGVLGRLNHPFIAQIIEAGDVVVEGRRCPFLAMEFVDGVDLLSFAEGRALSLRKGLELFEGVCSAVEAAHEQGIVHRDLKPANILVRREDGVPKVVDFGIARRLDQPLSDPTITQPGQLIGTLGYMSPEALSRSENTLETAADVYALGVMLYELVTGHPPRDLSGLSLMEAVRCIAEDPVLPIRGRKGAVDPCLRMIIATAMEPDPDRRYRSAGALRRDLQLFLDYRPIEARPPTAWMVITKFMRRHRELVAGLALAFVILIGGMAGVLWFALQAEEEAQANARLVEQESGLRLDAEAASGAAVEANRLLEIEVEAARSIEDFVLSKIVLAVHPRRRPVTDMSTKRVFEWAAASMEEQEFASVEAEARVRLLLAQAFYGMFSVGRALEQLNALERLVWKREIPIEIEISRLQILAAIQPPREELGTRRVLLELKRSANYDRAALASAELRIAHLELDQGHLEMAQRGYQRVLEELETLPEGRAYETHLLRGVADAASDFQDFERARRIGRRVVAEDRVRGHPLELADSLLSLAFAERYLGQYGDALRRVEESVLIYEDWMPPGHPGNFYPLFERATLKLHLGQFDEARLGFESLLPLMDQAIGVETSYAGRLHQMLGVLCAKADELNEAEAHYEAAERIFQRYDHPAQLGDLKTNWASLAMRRGDEGRAVELYREAVEIRRACLGSHHFKTGMAYQNLGAALGQVGRWDEAVEPLEEAEANPSLRGRAQAYGRWLLGKSYFETGEPGIGLELMGDGWERLRGLTRFEDDRRRGAFNWLIRYLVQDGRKEEAIELLREVLDTMPEDSGFQGVRVRLRRRLDSLLEGGAPTRD